jgi:hypothetical protein
VGGGIVDSNGKAIRWSHPLVVMLAGLGLTGTITIGSILVEIARTLDRIDRLEISIDANKTAIATQVEQAIAHSDNLDAQMSAVMSDRMNMISNRLEQRVIYGDKQFDKLMDTLSNLDHQLSAAEVAFARFEGILKQERDNGDRR